MSQQASDAPTRHRRIPGKHGGTYVDKNVSMVRYDRHQAYHCLYTTLLSPELVDEHNTLYRESDAWLFVAITRKIYSDKRKQERYIKRAIKGSLKKPCTETHQSTGKMTDKKRKALAFLFNNMLSPEIAAELSDIWIDPDWIIIAVWREEM